MQSHPRSRSSPESIFRRPFGNPCPHAPDSCPWRAAPSSSAIPPAVHSPKRGHMDTISVPDPLVDIHLTVLDRVFREGEVIGGTSVVLSLQVGHAGEVVMIHWPRRVEFLRTRCGRLSADELARVVRAVERLEASTLPRKRYVQADCTRMAGVFLRGDRERGFDYCGPTPHREVVELVDEVTASPRAPASAST